MKTVLLTLMVTMLTNTAGCHHLRFQTTQSGNLTVKKYYWERAEDAIRGIAEAELGSCKERKVILAQKIGKYPVLAVVTGCNQHAIYGKYNRCQLSHKNRVAWSNPKWNCYKQP